MKASPDSHLDDTPEASPDRAATREGLNRRAFLRGGAAVASTAALSGCGIPDIVMAPANLLSHGVKEAQHSAWLEQLLHERHDSFLLPLDPDHDPGNLMSTAGVFHPHVPRSPDQSLYTHIRVPENLKHYYEILGAALNAIVIRNHANTYNMAQGVYIERWPGTGTHGLLTVRHELVPQRADFSFGPEKPQQDTYILRGTRDPSGGSGAYGVDLRALQHDTLPPHAQPMSFVLPDDPYSDVAIAPLAATCGYKDVRIPLSLRLHDREPTPGQEVFSLAFRFDQSVMQVFEVRVGRVMDRAFAENFIRAERPGQPQLLPGEHVISYQSQPRNSGMPVMGFDPRGRIVVLGIAKQGQRRPSRGGHYAIMTSGPTIWHSLLIPKQAETERKLSEIKC